MTEIILKTGWKHWDMYLSKFVGKKINCLDIGSYTGASTCWMLNNLCLNPYSRVFSVDTWEGSAEYTEYTDSIEKKFDEAVEKTGRKDQHVKMKMTSSKALLKLKQFGFIIFDFIFIDASHEAKDVMSDAILSWDILNEEGILIFDDYKWDKLKGEEFRPKLAIDSFVAAFKPQLKTLYSGYQYIVEKIKLEDHTKPELDDYYKLINDINNYNYYNKSIIIDEDFKDNIKLDFKLGFIKNDELIDNIINNIKSLDKKIIFKSYIENSTIHNLIKHLNIYNINNKYDFKKVLKYYRIFEYLKKDMHILCNNKYLNKDHIIYLNEVFKINFRYNVSFNYIYINSIDIYKNLIKVNKKYDLFYFDSMDDLDKIKFKHIYQLFYLIYALNTQNLNGNILIKFNINYNIYFICQIISLFKKYYKIIKIEGGHGTKFNKTYIIIFLNFIGINKNELNVLNNLIFKIFEDNDTNINSISDYNYIYPKLYKYYIDKLNNIYNYVKILYRQNKLQPMQYTKIFNLLTTKLINNLVVNKLNIFNNNNINNLSNEYKKM
jgi:predicted O-methyltransferase YrrM